MREFLCLITGKDREFTTAEILSMIRSFASTMNYRFIVKRAISETHILHVYEIRHGFIDAKATCTEIYTAQRLDGIFIYLPDNDDMILGGKTKDLRLASQAFNHLKRWPETN